MVPKTYKIAVMRNPHKNWPTIGGYFARNLGKYCQCDWFTYGSEPGSYDHYLYVDDSPSAYMEPNFRPASYYAFDLVLPHLEFLHKPELYLERIRNFDHGFVSSTAALEYCRENGVNAKLLLFAADHDYHKPHPVKRWREWIAVHHNMGKRAEACNLAKERFPTGHVLWAGKHLYAEYISTANCIINMLRGNLVNMRVIEAMAIGTPLITTRNPDMEKAYGFIEGEHYLGHDSVEEMLDQIEWVNQNLDEALEMARRAREYVMVTHMYTHRALQIFKEIHG